MNYSPNDKTTELIILVADRGCKCTGNCKLHTQRAQVKYLHLCPLYAPRMLWYYCDKHITNSKAGFVFYWIITNLSCTSGVATSLAGASLRSSSWEARCCCWVCCCPPEAGVSELSCLLEWISSTLTVVEIGVDTGAELMGVVDTDARDEEWLLLLPVWRGVDDEVSGRLERSLPPPVVRFTRLNIYHNVIDSKWHQVLGLSYYLIYIAKCST